MLQVEPMTKQFLFLYDAGRLYSFVGSHIHLQTFMYFQIFPNRPEDVTKLVVHPVMSKRIV